MSKSLNKEQLIIIMEFNRKIKLLIGNLGELSSDLEFYNIKRKVLIAIENTPVLIIQILGPYLKQYKQQIENGDVQFFLTGKFDFQSNIEIESIFNKIKKVFPQFSESKQKQYILMSQQLLCLIAQYEHT
jgi:hypothetical protein